MSVRTNSGGSSARPERVDGAYSGPGSLRLSNSVRR